MHKFLLILNIYVVTMSYIMTGWRSESVIHFYNSYWDTMNCL